MGFLDSAGVKQLWAAIKNYIEAHPVIVEKQGVIPVGTCLWDTSGKNPHDQGLLGTWSLKTRAYLPMTGNTTAYYVWQKVADGVGDEGDYPKGTVLWQTVSTNPADLGVPGTWKQKTKAYIPMSDGTAYYLFERTA